jgi:hypothetical protein
MIALILISLVALASASLKDEKITSILELTISIEDQDAGKVYLGLFGDVVPKTAENFRALCTGDADTYSIIHT